MPALNLELKVEYNPDRIFTSPSDVASAWVDITSKVRWKDTTTSIQRGRQDESGNVTPATLTVTLDNADGRFLPDNTSSPLYPNWTYPLWIRVSVVDTPNSINKTLISAIIDSIEPDVTGENSDRVVVVTATDQLKRMDKFGDIQSFLHEEIQLDQPLAYYPLDDGAGVQSFADQSGNGNPPVAIQSMGALGEIDTGGTTGPPAAGESAPNFSPRYPQLGDCQGKYLKLNLKQPLTIGDGHPYTIEWWQKNNNNGAYDTSDLSFKFFTGIIAALPSTSNGIVVGYYQPPQTASNGVSGAPPNYWGGGVMLLTNGDRLSTSVSRGYGGHMQPGEWYHYAIVSDGANPLNDDSGKYYVNGHLAQTIDLGGIDPPPSTVQNLTEFTIAGAPAFGGGLLNGSVAHVAIYDHEVTGDRILEHFMAGVTGFAGEPLDYRVGRIFAYVANPGYYNNPPGPDFPNQPVTAQGAGKALELINALEETEQGVFFIDGNGDPKLFDRSHRYTSNQITLSAAPGTGDIGPGGIAPIYDDQRFRNDVKATTASGATYRAVDTASVDADGRYADTVDSIAANPANAEDTARMRLKSRKIKQPRYAAVEVQLRGRSAALAAAVVGAEIWDRLNVTSIPAGYTVPPLAIEGISYEFSITSWRVKFNVSPNLPQGPVYQVGVAGADEISTSTARLGF